MTTMFTEAPATSVLGVFDDSRYAELAVDKATSYQTADPFAHGVYDNFLPTELARELSAAFPTPDSMAWISRNNTQNRRRYQHDETKLPALHRAMLREFNSRQFVLFLETLTGIDNLIPDPYFIGGGLHLSGPGDFLNVHADFNWHHKLQAHRRVNALMYLSDTWDESWDGAVEFWDKDMTGPVDKAYPFFNRLVVFSTGENSNHGQPMHNKCPEGSYRKVINLYYYTTHRDDEDAAAQPHFTLYKTDASDFASGLGADYRRSGQGS